LERLGDGSALTEVRMAEHGEIIRGSLHLNVKILTKRLQAGWGKDDWNTEKIGQETDSNHPSWGWCQVVCATKQG
jgi:hypothetical protein